MSMTADVTSVQRTGYNPSFIGHRVEHPKVADDDVVMVDGSPVVHYTRFSLSMSKSRRMCRWVAWNIDGGSLPDPNGPGNIGRDDLAFTLDPRITAAAQIDNSVYKRNRLDRGHIARRADLLWGERAEALRANSDSFFLTNITPQMDNFNQSALRGVWGRLENALLDSVKDDNARVSVMAGPVLASSDPAYRGVQVPLEFWKLLVYERDGELRTRGFIVTQSLDGLKERDPFAEFVVMEKTVEEIAQKADVEFDPELSTAQYRGRDRTRALTPVVHNAAEIAW